MTEAVERERLDVDLLFVGAGPATLGAAIKLADLCEEKGVEPPMMLIVEKAAEVGEHQLSGAVMDPRGIEELIPDYKEKGFPVHHEVTWDAMYWLTPKWKLASPITPPNFANHGNLVVSASDVVKWLAEQAAARGIEVYPGFPASELIYDGDKVVGVRVQDRGIDKDGVHKSVFEAGPEIYAQCVILGEGPRGSCTKQLHEKHPELACRNPEVFATGIKEIWKIKPENHRLGRVLHTMGWPHDPTTFGGGWLYDLKDNQISLGFVTGLNYDNPHTDPHDNMQRFKLHPMISKILEGGECIRYGAKTLPAGGWFATPRQYMNGALLIGDSGGTCNAERLKGVHTAIKSGMLAAETLLEAIRKDDYSAESLSSYAEAWKTSWAGKEHYKARNFHASFGFTQKMPSWLGWARQLPWIANGQALAMITGGRGLFKRVKSHPDHTHMKKLSQLSA